MATRFNTQAGNGEYRLQFETDKKEHYLFLQEMARRCVDSEPVTAEWIKLDECDYQCSECGFRFTSADPISKFEYCRCGARMKGAKDE